MPAVNGWERVFQKLLQVDHFAGLDPYGPLALIHHLAFRSELLVLYLVVPATRGTHAVLVIRNASNLIEETLGEEIGWILCLYFGGITFL